MIIENMKINIISELCRVYIDCIMGYSGYVTGSIENMKISNNMTSGGDIVGSITGSSNTGSGNTTTTNTTTNTATDYYCYYYY